MRDDAWAAGLYEGEGSLGMQKHRGYPRLSLGMTDREPVEWFRDVLGFGSIHVQVQPGRRDMHRFEGGGWVNVAATFERFKPYLSPRRVARFEETLAQRPVRPTSPDCADPTPAAYRRHLRVPEPPCAPCRLANTEAERARKGAAPRYPDGEGYRR